jgi:pyruvate dehydrogenase E2 component (dihydrolipoamide acetyltransferase)
MVEFVMPILGADMSAGTLIGWRKKAGDPVKRGDVIAEVETDKGLIDVEIFVAGLLEKILVSEEEHIDWLEAQLELIEQVGAQNYLAQQIHES